jgi:hypothetical protein
MTPLVRNLHRCTVDLVVPTRSNNSGRQSSQFHCNTKAPSQRQGAVQKGGGLSLRQFKRKLKYVFIMILNCPRRVSVGGNYVGCI